MAGRLGPWSAAYRSKFHRVLPRCRPHHALLEWHPSHCARIIAMRSHAGPKLAVTVIAESHRQEGCSAPLQTSAL